MSTLEKIGTALGLGLVSLFIGSLSFMFIMVGLRAAGLLP